MGQPVVTGGLPAGGGRPERPPYLPCASITALHGSDRLSFCFARHSSIRPPPGATLAQSFLASPWQAARCWAVCAIALGARPRMSAAAKPMAGILKMDITASSRSALAGSRACAVSSPVCGKNSRGGPAHNWRKLVLLALRRFCQGGAQARILGLQRGKALLDRTGHALDVLLGQACRNVLRTVHVP